MLFHYNGHGVPKPTANGEIWVFNKVLYCLVLSTVIIFLESLVHGFIMVLIMWYLVQSYTQYIPLSVSELDSCLQTPSIYVFDCSAAGMIVNAFTEVCNAWLVHRQA